MVLSRSMARRYPSDSAVWRKHWSIMVRS